MNWIYEPFAGYRANSRTGRTDGVHLELVGLPPRPDMTNQRLLETFAIGLENATDFFRKVILDGSPMANKHIDNDDIGHIYLLSSETLETL